MNTSLADGQSGAAKLLDVFVLLVTAIGAILTSLNWWLRGLLQQLGVPHDLQTVVALSLTALLVLGCLRHLGGFVRLAVVLFLLAVAYHIAMPALQSRAG